MASELSEFCKQQSYEIKQLKHKLENYRAMTAALAVCVVILLLIKSN